MRFNPPQADVTSGGSFTAAVVLDGATDVAQAPLRISFDPKMLRLNGVTAGDLMSADGQQPVFSIQNDTGQATVQLSRQPGAPGVTVPTGVLVNLNFQALGKGATTVTMPSVTVRNTQGQVVAAGNPQMTVNIK